MNDTQIKVFTVTAWKKSMTKAADILYISVPAVKRHIDALEKELNCSLFIRSNQGLVLTAEGEEFLIFSERMLSELKKEQETLARIRKQKTEVIHIGYETLHIRDNIFLDACAEYLRLNPSSSILVDQSDEFNLKEHDIFFGISYREDPDIRAHLIADLPLICIMNASDPDSKQKELHIENLDTGRTVFPPAELLMFTRPPFLDLLPDKNIHFSDGDNPGPNYIPSVILNGKTIVYIGLEKYTQHTIIQKPLHGITFPYHCYTSTKKETPYLKEFISFLKTYYKNSLENLESVIEP